MVTDTQDLSLFVVADDEEAVPLSGKPEQMTVPIKRPSAQHAFVICPDPRYRRTVRCYRQRSEESIEETLYLIHPELGALVPESVRKVGLFLYVTPSGSYGLMPVNLNPQANGSLNSYAESLLAIVAEYAGQWIRVRHDKAAGGYAVVPMKVPAAPLWPERDMDAIINRAFGQRRILSRDHPILLDQLPDHVD